MYTYNVLWSGACLDHSQNTCRCTLLVSWDSVPIDPITVERVDRQGKIKTYREQVGEVLKELAHKYYLKGDEVVRKEFSNEDDHDLLELAYDYFSCESNSRIAPPFHNPNNPKKFEIPQLPFQEPIVERINDNFFKAIGIDRPKPNTLAALAYKNLSLYHICYDKYNGFKAMLNTSENMTKDKVAKLYQEFFQPGVDRLNFHKVQKYLSRALAFTEQALEVSKHKHTVRFMYRPEMLKYFISTPMASSGIRPGGTVVEDHIRFVTGGKKVDQFAYYAKRFNDGIINLRQNGLNGERKQRFFEYYCQMSLKNEFKFVYPVTVEDAAKLKNKCREFQIANTMQQMLSKLLMTPRQLLERGDYIRIGQKWNHGGAQDFAEFMLAGHPDIVWHTGDFEKLDKTVKDYLLSLYVASGQQYFRVARDDSQLLEDLFVLLTEKIAVKIVNHVGGAWTLMKSAMYSGGYETSHGDSWIVLIVWFTYVVYTMDKYPKHADYIKRNLFKTIKIAVYGDDHVWSTPTKISHILNENLYQAFVLEHFDMKIRDPSTIREFFSTVLPNGELGTVGVVFLKRYFITDSDPVSGYPFILPFKPTHESLLKLFCSKDGRPSTAVVQAIGQAYDTLGTNRFAYDQIKLYYEYYHKITHMDLVDVVEKFKADYKNDHVYLNSIRILLGGDLERLVQGFPSYEFLHSLHLYDSALNTNKKGPYMTTEEIYSMEVDEDYDLYREYLY